ncbi:MAG: AAA family ATPase [Thermaceae bacterium]|nr:AAA family ATPase [Thermaceae bacterium]
MVRLYQGEFLEGLSFEESPEFESWAALQRDWLRRELGQALRQLGEPPGIPSQEALRYAQHWVGLEPLNEAAHRLLMRRLAESGQRAEAMRQYQVCAALLETELSCPPEEETLRLYQSIKENQLPLTEAINPTGPVAVLPRLPSLLIGREDPLQDLKKRLGIGGKRQALTVVEGWPGVGKSTLLAALARDDEVARAFPDGVLWVSLGESPNPLAKLLLWADALHLSGPGRDHTAEGLTNRLRASLRDRQTLILIDDVWRLEDALPFLIGGQASATVLSSRLGGIAEALAPTPEDLYRLSPLDEGRSLELLKRISPETVRGYPQAAQQLVRSLEGLPLAIGVAGRLLESEARLGGDPGQVLKELQRGVGLLEAPLPGDLIGSRPTPLTTVGSLLQRSTAGLEPQVQERFAALGLLAPKPLPFDLAALGALWGVEDPKPTLRILIRRGLLEGVPGGRFQMHTLLALQAQNLLKAEPPLLERTLRQRYTRHYLMWLQTQQRPLLGVGQQEAIAAIGRELEHLRQAWLWAVEDGEGELIERALVTLSAYVTHTGRLNLGAELYAPAAARAWPRVTTQAYLISIYGWIQILLGQNVEGEALMRQGLEQLRQRGIQGPIPAVALACLGSWLTLSQRHAEAEAFFQRSSEALRSRPDLDSDWARVQLEGFWASLELARGRPKAALERTETALKLAQTVRDGVQTSWVRGVQAEILLQQGQIAQAEALIRTNWRYFREVDNRWGAVNALKFLGLLAAQRGQIETALDYLEEALEGVAQVGDRGLSLEIAQHIASLRSRG